MDNMDKFWGLLNALTRDDFLHQSYDFERDVGEVADDVDCVVVLPEANQLQLDIDCDQQYIFYRGRLDDLRELGILDIKDVEETPSKSGLPKRHIIITCGRDFSEAERIAVQFALGSDIIRETLNTMRLLSSNGKDAGCCFFEPIQDEDE